MSVSESSIAVRSLASEFAGTALLVAAVVGSGIMGERLAQGNAAVTLLANSLATGGVLAALILALGPISGAHFNPLVSAAAWAHGEMTATSVGLRAVVQCLGGLVGTGLANAMFELPILFASQHVRSGIPQWLGEVIATFGLIVVVRLAPSPFAPPAYIVGAYWFTSSTSFANPAVTLARTMSDTFSGIRPMDAPGFLVAQAVGCVAAILFCRWISISGGKPHVSTFR